MAKRNILSSNKKTLTPVSVNADKIFNYLRTSEKIKTQSQIVKALGISQSTVRNILLKWINDEEEFEFGKYYYRVVREANGYKVIKTPKTIDRNRIGEYAFEQKEEYINRRFNNLSELLSKKATSASEAIVLTQTVILYPLVKSSKTRQAAIEMLKGQYMGKIYDVVQCKEGVYIILKETDRLEHDRISVCNFYDDLVGKIKSAQQARKSPTKSKKEDVKTEGS